MLTMHNTGMMDVSLLFTSTCTNQIQAKATMQGRLDVAPNDNKQTSSQY